ncbi:MAG: anthranilate phosphoribosyltransferase [Candidatus Binatota bacterium]|nr:anthranilate phosphoribosyltransferase [Candidatus Binatota bacterium]
MTVREAIARLADGESLGESDMEAAIGEIMEGSATPAQIGAFLALLRRKGETIDEISGAARAMRRCVTAIRGNDDVLDTCGTGGDDRHTFNISTAAALVAAAAGCRVAKHGNRAMSGRVGGADVLEHLGFAIDREPEVAERMLRELGFAFLFAPRLHPAMKHAAGPRRELGVRTIFNLLGPLTNPAGARHQLLGVFDRRWLEPIAEVLGRLGSVHALVVHGEDGLDEITVAGPTMVAELRGGTIRRWTIEPEALGLRRSTLEELRVDGVAASAELVRAVLTGASGAPRDVVLLNAGAAIYAADRAATLEEGIERARRAIDTGAAQDLLERVVERSRAA